MVAQSWEDITSASVAGATGIAGAVTTAAGLPVVGAAIAGGGQMVSGLMNLLKPAPKVPGPSGAMMVNLERAEATAGRASEMTGLSPAEIANFDEITMRSKVRSAAIANAYNAPYAMSPIEQELLWRNIMSEQQANADKARRELMNMDAAAIRTRMSNAIAANNEAARQANAVQAMQIQKDLTELSLDQQKWSNFVMGMSDSAELVAGAIDYDEAQKLKKEEELKQIHAKTIANTNTTGGGQEILMSPYGGNMGWGDAAPTIMPEPMNLNQQYLAQPTSDKSKGDRNRLIVMENAPALYPYVYGGQ